MSLLRNVLGRVAVLVAPLMVVGLAGVAEPLRAEVVTITGENVGTYLDEDLFTRGWVEGCPNANPASGLCENSVTDPEGGEGVLLLSVANEYVTHPGQGEEACVARDTAAGVSNFRTVSQALFNSGQIAVSDLDEFVGTCQGFNCSPPPYKIIYYYRPAAGNQNAASDYPRLKIKGPGLPGKTLFVRSGGSYVKTTTLDNGWVKVDLSDERIIWDWSGANSNAVPDGFDTTPKTLRDWAKAFGKVTAFPLNNNIQTILLASGNNELGLETCEYVNRRGETVVGRKPKDQTTKYGFYVDYLTLQKSGGDEKQVNFALGSTFEPFDPTEYHILKMDRRVTKDQVEIYLAGGLPIPAEGRVSDFSVEEVAVEADGGKFYVRAKFDWNRDGKVGEAILGGDIYTSGNKFATACVNAGNNDPFVEGLISVEQFGKNSTTGKVNQIKDGKSAFWCMKNLNGGAGFEQLDTSNLEDFYEMFRNANRFNADVSHFDTSRVTKFDFAFDDATRFNQNIGSWNTSAAKTMYQMFTGAANFDQDISTKGDGKWDVSGVTNMGNMFQNAASFNQPIGNWNVTKVAPSEPCTDEKPYDCNKGMSGMFARATSFNQDLSGWDVSAFVPDAPLPNSQRLAFDQGLDDTWTGKNPATGNYWCNKGRPHFDGEECGAPDAPTNLVATAGNTEVHITFDEPDDNGAAISDYEYSLNNGAEVSAGDISPSITISNLTNGTSYSIRIRAVNAAGDGAWSEAVSATPESGAAPPDAPTNLAVVSTASGVITLSFTAGNSNGSEITGYQASWEEVSGPSVEDDDPLSSDGFVSVSGTGSPVTVSGLTDGRTYDITLRAVNAEGPGGDSDPISVRLPATSNLYPPSTDVPSVNLKLTSAASCSIDTSGSAHRPHSPSTPLPDAIATVEDVEVEFDLLCNTPGETVGITLEFPDIDITETARLFKIRDNGDWDEIEDATFDYVNDSVAYTITDWQGETGYEGYDLNSTAGKMRDPVVVAYKIDTDGDGVPDTEDACPTDPTCSARPVPTLTWPVLLTLFGLVGWLGYRRLAIAQ